MKAIMHVLDESMYHVPAKCDDLALRHTTLGWTRNNITMSRGGAWVQKQYMHIIKGLTHGTGLHLVVPKDRDISFMYKTGGQNIKKYSGFLYDYHHVKYVWLKNPPFRRLCMISYYIWLSGGPGEPYTYFTSRATTQPSSLCVTLQLSSISVCTIFKQLLELTQEFFMLQ